MSTGSEYYKKYMNSDRWKSKRLRVLQRDNYICQACLKNRATEVHHKTYLHFGNEPLFDLVSVCSICHVSLTNSDHLYKKDKTIEDHLKAILLND